MYKANSTYNSSASVSSDEDKLFSKWFIGLSGQKIGTEKGTENELSIIKINQQHLIFIQIQISDSAPNHIFSRNPFKTLKITP